MSCALAQLHANKTDNFTVADDYGTTLVIMEIMYLLLPSYCCSYGKTYHKHLFHSINLIKTSCWLLGVAT